MATTAAESAGAQPARRGRPRKQTTLDSDITKPQVTEPGDAPFDTTDPTERASSVMPDFAAAAQAGHGVVNAVVPLPKREDNPDSEKKADRVETYHAQRPDGTWVKVTHNLDTGETDTD